MKHFLEREFVIFRVPETFFSKIISTILVLNIKSHVLQRHSFPVKIDPFEATCLFNHRETIAFYQKNPSNQSSDLLVHCSSRIICASK